MRLIKDAWTKLRIQKRRSLVNILWTWQKILYISYVKHIDYEDIRENMAYFAWNDFLKRLTDKLHL